MTITVSSLFHCGTAISEEQFVAEIRRRGAMAATNPLWRGMNPEDAARQAYQSIVAYPGESAEAWLAIAQHEHTFGLNASSVLARNDTASWTNARSVRLTRLKDVPRVAAPPMAGTYQIVYDASRRSDYVRYANVIDSLLDGIWRIRDPQYAYRNARTIGEVIAIWAPNDDANDAEGYAQTVAAEINATRARYAGQEPMMQPPSGWKPPQIVRSIIEWDASNRPHQRLNGGSWDFITTHNTGNPNAGANAAMHAAWMHNLGKAGAEEPSWHYTVDEAVIYQHMEDDWAGYHASDNTGPGNFDSLGIELVEIGNLTLVIWNAAWLVAKKMKERGKTDIAAVVKQHNHFARDGKNCPRLLRANDGAGWRVYMGAIDYFLSQSATADAASRRFQVPEVGEFTVGGGFLRYWDEFGGLAIFGYPLTDEITEDGRTVQYFERAVMEHHPGAWPERYDVMLRRVGAMALEQKHAA